MRLFANLIDQFRIPMPRAAFNEFILVQDPLDNFPILLRVWKIHGLTFGGGGGSCYASSNFYQYTFKLCFVEDSLQN
jgi:hypothetical protein